MFENKLAGKNITITGSSGYVGGNLLKRLKGLPANVVGIDKDVRYEDGEEHEFSLYDYDKLQDVIVENGSELVIHAGTNSAISYRERFINSFDEDWASLRNLLDVVNKFSNKPRIVFFSSSYVYSAVGEALVNENSSLAPKHNFGLSKRFMEDVLFRSHQNTVIFRMSSVFGPGDPIWPNSIEDMLREARETGRVTVWGSGSRKMQFLFIEDVMRFVLQSADIGPGVYNLGGQEYLSVADVASVIGEETGVPIEFLPEKKEGENLVQMDTTKLQNATGDEFSPVPDALREYIRSTATI